MPIMKEKIYEFRGQLGYFGVCKKYDNDGNKDTDNNDDRSDDAYQRTETPSQEHSIMTKFIVQPYAATVFDIYQKPHIRHGSFHYFNFAKRCIRSLGIESEIWQEVVKPNFLRVGTW